MSEELKKLEELLANDRKNIEENYKEIERLSNELQVQIEDNTRLNEYIEEQEQKLQQKENIIKEVREKIKELCWDYEYETYSNMTSDEVKELAGLLDKENK